VSKKQYVKIEISCGKVPTLGRDPADPNDNLHVLVSSQSRLWRDDIAEGKRENKRENMSGVLESVSTISLKWIVYYRSFWRQPKNSMVL